MKKKKLSKKPKKVKSKQKLGTLKVSQGFMFIESYEDTLHGWID